MNGRAPTEKQAAATARNWGIRNLRALHAQASQLSPSNRAIVHAAIDAELVQRGALPTEQHKLAQAERERKRFRCRFPKPCKCPTCDYDIPF